MPGTASAKVVLDLWWKSPPRILVRVEQRAGFLRARVTRPGLGRCAARGLP